MISIGANTEFAIQSEITRAFPERSLMALGYFVYLVRGRQYGVRRADATMLAPSFDAILRRIERCGTHISDAAEFAAPRDIAFAYLRHRYGRDDLFPPPTSTDVMMAEVASNEIVMAPDGDAAFDDDSHLLQFDVGQSVRVVAFRNRENAMEVVDSVAEIWMMADAFYGILSDWSREFMVAWDTQTKRIHHS